MEPPVKFSHLFNVASSGCWEWRRTGNNGYGVYAYSKFNRPKSMTAHRAVWIHMKGPIPEGLQLDHLCRNKCCVNPDHLEPVTASENQKRAQLHKARPNAPGYCCRGHVMDRIRKDNPNKKYCSICRAAADRARNERKKLSKL